MIPLCVPNISEAEQEYVQKAVAAGWVSSAGPEVKEFEERMASYCGAQYGVAVSSGTAALHLSLLVCGVERGDLVIVPNLSFVAAINAIRYTGAVPLLVDAEPDHWQMDVNLVEAFLVNECVAEADGCYHQETRQRVKAILPVHVLGHLADISRLSMLASRFNLVLIEDAAESLGSKEGPRHAGTFGEIGCLSFNGNKIMTTGGGGLILTHSQKLAEHARHLSTQAKSHPEEYLHDEVGYNYRLSNVHAALGLAQLDRMDSFLKRKKEVFTHYGSAFQELDQVTPFPKGRSGTHPNYWMYTILSPEARQLDDYLFACGVQTRKLWVPMNRMPMNHDCRYLSKNDHAVQIYENSVSLPCSTGITEEELQEVSESVVRFFSMFKA